MQHPDFLHETATLAAQQPLASGYVLLTLHAPRIAAQARPGQFIHARIPGLENSALRRPFSIYDAQGEMLSILYKRVGRGTEQLAALAPGVPIDFIGPLGNGFPALCEGMTPVLVAGGYGVAPLHFFARRVTTRGHLTRGHLFVGGRTASDILCVDAFENLSWTVHITTEDASLGIHGRVTDALLPWFVRNQAPVEIFACGPDGMLRALSQLDVPTWVSLDKHMVCGVGACLACVQKIRQPDGSAAQLRVCHDGPIFEARSVVW